MKSDPQPEISREAAEPDPDTRSSRGAEPVYDRVILLLLFALFLLLSPIVEWWAADDSPWFAPYLIWGLLIVLTLSLRRVIDRHSTEERHDD